MPGRVNGQKGWFMFLRFRLVLSLVNKDLDLFHKAGFVTLLPESSYGFNMSIPTNAPVGEVRSNSDARADFLSSHYFNRPQEGRLLLVVVYTLFLDASRA